MHREFDALVVNSIPDEPIYDENTQLMEWNITINTGTKL